MPGGCVFGSEGAWCCDARRARTALEELEGYVGVRVTMDMDTAETKEGRCRCGRTTRERGGTAKERGGKGRKLKTKGQ